MTTELRPRSRPSRRKLREQLAGPLGVLGVALLAFIGLGAWAVSSPVGSSPDDRYHLASIWCSETGGESCEKDEDGRNLLPAALMDSPCFLGSPTTSAGCQPFMDGTDPRLQPDPGSNVQTNLYPGGFYFTLHQFVQQNIELAVIGMRLFNVGVFVAIGALLWLTLVPRLRRTLLWTWSLTLVPLAAFMIPSTNPTSWAIIGVGMAWLALLGYFEATGWRMWVLGLVYLLSVGIATSARSDATLFVGATSIIALLMTQAELKTILRRFALPATAGIAVIVWLLIRPGQIGIISEGFGQRSGQSYPDELPWQSQEAIDAGVQASGFDWALLWYNMWDVPALWLGMFGDYPWGALGWLDTVMPQSVTVLVTWIILGVTFIALQRAWWQKWVAAGLMIALSWGIPVWTLQLGGHKTGEQIQPRYLLPLLIVAIGVLLLQKTSDQVLVSSRAAQIGVIIALSLANSLALHTNFRRYTTGTVQGGADLDYQREWWWMSFPDFLDANATWAIGSLAFLGLIWIMLSQANSASLELSREKTLPHPQS